MGLWDIGIATIFAREFLEASIIIGQYRTVIKKSDNWKPEDEPAALKAVNQAATVAFIVAVILCVCTIIPLAVLSNEMDDKTADIIEGVSKVVAAVCILQLSLKIPKFMGFYPSKKKEKDAGATMKEIRFNVAWNIWREMAECGVFLIPFILDGEWEAIPLSALAGTVIALIMGGLIYWGNKKQQSRFNICVFMSYLLAQLSTGLFVGGCHEFEEVWGETKKVWKIEADFWNHKELPMAIIKPFGYSSSRTELQIACFWSWTALAAGLHVWKYKQAQKLKEQKSQETDSDNDVDKQVAPEEAV
uniref:Uncharacterized protein n=1 Tax=Leptocylindrus danicus TaxID=163516 RepID=A0A7S2LHM7_9STRA|mmetsp:Transcript_5014/g.7361  ORF Transcript_5014/g.7361 Transcript_5014/m.7361 type:complete len:303 (+) Transcript_5014:91-999(+)|eukprot:CAMPEP_0116028506 /NCGR_PEP_ID=MMETSP0321-20121206/15457_1 /TAXON_ID=163516 /ORGANISM="Leptocylindrus danicus var. danicus, Strain B650" /LENGTH=302 /DNA_ID=CAMNT_0003502449 /DNA_START=90 /DNA_END=998 /DNA_ORIENTATION=+